MKYKEPASSQKHVRMARGLLCLFGMKKTKKIRASRERLPDRASELLVNQRMLEAHRDEIKKEIRSLDHKFSSKFSSFDEKFCAIDGRFNYLESKIDSLSERQSTDFHKLMAISEKQSVDIARVIALVEEQRNLTLSVLDGYQSIYDRQDRVEHEVAEMKQTLLVLKKT